MNNNVSLTVGSYDNLTGSFDVGGSLSESNSVLFRLNGLVRDSDMEIDYGKNNRVFFAPSLLWNISPSTDITFLADITRDDMTPKSWWPDEALRSSSEHPKISRKLFAGEPDFDKYERDVTSLTYIFNHQFSEEVSLRQNAKYTHFELEYNHIYAWGWEDHQSVSRGSLTSNVESDIFTIDTQLISQWSLGESDHQLLFGIDIQKISGEEDLGFGNAASLNVVNPVYGDEMSAIELEKSTLDAQQYGYYLQDNIKINDWIINVGLRHDKAKVKYIEGTKSQNDDKTSYNLGLLHRLNHEVSLYTSYAKSFEPIIGRKSYDSTPSGSQLKPETGSQVEFGAKYQPTGHDILYTASVFDLRKQNVVSDDDDHPGFSVQRGEETSQGLELQAVGSINEQLQLSASYTYLDAIVSKSTITSEIGQKKVQAAKHSASVWGDYQFSGGSFDGLKLGAGTRYVGKVPGYLEGDYYNLAYILVDFAANYQFEQVKLSLNISNLMNESYTANDVQFYGAGRNIQANVTYQW
jgi:iron complex outermembrane receptor protein